MSEISKELIENYRKIVLPFVSNQLYKANFEGQGETDKTEFEQDFNVILDLAIKALEERPQGEWLLLSEQQPPKSGYYITSTIYNQVYCDYWSVDHFDRTETVLAWMPLPEPYKKGGAENDIS